MNQVKLKYLCSSYSTPITQEQIQEEGEFRVYGAGGLTGYLPVAGCKSDYLGIIKDGAGVGRINAYEAGSYLLGTMAYIVPNSEIDINWLKYAVMSLNLSESISKTTIPHIYFSEYGNRKVGWCSTEMQRRIADFLDRKCAEIDSVMANTRRTIEEYKKLKQSIITEAVTKGVRGKRPMKDSGIAWIGEIPEEWKFSPLKYIAKLQPTCDAGKFNDDTEITYTPMDCIKNGYFVQNTAKFGTIASSLTPYEEGDIVMAKVTPCFENGNIAIMENLASGFGMGSSELFVYRAISVNSRFLLYWLQNDIFKDGGCATMTGTGGLKRISPYYAKNAMILLPSDEEQIEIVAYLDKKCAEMDRLIISKEHLLTELESYKKSVIYEYVTGKKEVPVCR